MAETNTVGVDAPGINGFVQVHPRVLHTRTCPRCERSMTAYDWCIPGQWTLGHYRCGACGFDCWADLPYFLGVLSPCYVDTRTGDVLRPCGPEWYANLTRAAWSRRGRRPVKLRRAVRRHVRRICLVNALGNNWGDAILTVARLNALDTTRELDIVVVTTANLEPHVRQQAAEVWLVDDSHAGTAFWNDDLADAVKAEVARFDECYVPTIFQHPAVTTSDVATLSGIQPFDRTRWDEALERRPTVTFLWRDDRCWYPEAHPMRQMWSRAGSSSRFRRGARLFHEIHARLARRGQHRRVITLARQLRSALPKLDFAVCGQGSYGSFPDWIKDLRSPRADTEANRLWCDRASQSHLVIGVLGSQMALPSGHAGAVLDLIPSDFLRNVLTDWLVTTDDVREALFLYRMLPLGTDAVSVAETAISMLVNYSCARSSLHAANYAPLPPGAVERLTAIQNERARILRTAVSSRAAHLIGP